MDELLLRTAIGGVLIALMTGPLGACVVWQRMVYFNETIAHSVLLGLGIGLLAEVQPLVAVLGVAVAVALLLASLRRDPRFSMDALLGLLAHGSLALGLVLLSFAPQQVNLHSILFGDILAIGWGDITTLAVLVVVVIASLSFGWKRLLRRMIDPAVASTLGECPHKTDICFTLLLALVVAFCFQWVGVLLLTSLLIIPALSARLIAQSPVFMALQASVLGCASVLLGLYTSYRFDVPTAPMMVVVALCIFITLYVLRPNRERN